MGIDLGITHLVTLSDGEVISNPRHLKRRLKKLNRLQRTVSRRQKGSKNRKKAVRKLARLHRQIKNQRRNTLHQVTTRLAKTKSVLVLDRDLNAAINLAKLARSASLVCTWRQRSRNPTLSLACPYLGKFGRTVDWPLSVVVSSSRYTL